MFFKLDTFSRNLISIGFLFSAIAIILLPNGLINLGFLMILIGFLANSKTYKLETWIDLPRPFWLMLLFFIWVLASFLWSHADSLDSIEHLRKARVFLFVPLFFVALSYLDFSKVLMTKNLLFFSLCINVLIVYRRQSGLRVMNLDHLVKEGE